MPLVEISRSFVFQLRDKKILPKRGVWFANYVTTVLGIIFRFAHDRGWIDQNPLQARIKKLRGRSGSSAKRPWTEQECKVVMDHAPHHLKLPLALAMYAGLRKADFLSVTRAAIANGEILVRTSKRGVAVRIPVHPELAEILRTRPDSPAVQLAVNVRGQPWTESGFNSSFIKFRSTLENKGLIASGLTPHGLRHTLATRLREAGADDRTIADVLGQKSLSMARHYSDGAELPNTAKQLVTSLAVTRKQNKS